MLKTVAGDSKQSSLRDIANLRAALRELNASAGGVRTVDGWRLPLPHSRGYRHVYDANIARGGWEFYELRHGLWLLTVDMVPSVMLPRRHSFGDKLVLSAVLRGDVDFNDPTGAQAGLANGYCTVYGMSGGEFETVYDPGATLKWVSIIIDRERLVEITMLDQAEMPECVRQFYQTGCALPYRNVLLSSASSLAARQILDCRFENSSRLAFLTAKTLELACLTLFTMRDEDNGYDADPTLTDTDRQKVAKARELIGRSLDEPPTIAALAASVGLTRQKLQEGFRDMYGGTAGQIRDQLRIERALDLVRNSRLSMIDIGMETGYEHAASFTRAFKAAYGMAPIEMRRCAKLERRKS